MKKSLLGHLYSHIKGSAEDVATMSLQYLITYYDTLNNAFNGLMANRLHADVPSDISYDCQPIGEELERPDMSGTDSEGNEVILCEAKFYAGLTSNQPLTYLKRLRNENGVGLVFICPQERIVSLWDTLLKKCEKEELTSISDYCVSVGGTNMAVVSWEEIISLLQMTAGATQKDSLADIAQLEGYCEQIMKESFIPFKEEDLGAITAKKYERYMYIADQLVAALEADPSVEISTKGLKSTAYRHGYNRYFFLNGMTVSFRMDLEFWSDDRYVDTPYWVSFMDREWRTPEKYKEASKHVPATRRTVLNKEPFFLAIDVPCNVTEDAVVESIKEQVIEYSHIFENL